MVIYVGVGRAYPSSVKAGLRFLHCFKGSDVSQVVNDLFRTWACPLYKCGFWGGMKTLLKTTRSQHINTTPSLLPLSPNPLPSLTG